MPRTADAYQEIKDARRTLILSAACRVFARSGLAATRIGDIAAEAGMSQGLLYHYFRTKEALFTAIVESALHESAAITREALTAQGPAWQRLERLAQRLIEGVLAAPEAPLIILQAFASTAIPAEARTAADTYGVQTHEQITALIREGQAEGSVVEGDPVELSFALTACIQGIALSRLQARSADAALPTAATVLRMLRA